MQRQALRAPLRVRRELRAVLVVAQHWMPALGEMHVYGRYAIVASFFLCLIVAMVMEPLVGVRTSLPVARWAFGLVAAAIAIQGVVTYLGVKYTELIRSAAAV